MAYKVLAKVPINGKEKYFGFDVVKERVYSESMNIASQPISTGDSVSDHSYRQPYTVQLNGSFSTRGSWSNKDYYTASNIKDEVDENDTYFQAGGEGAELNKIIDEPWARLANIELFWKWVMKHGILFDLLMIDLDSSSEYNIRFVEKNNVAINSLSFTEMYDSMTFSMGVKEIITVSTSQFEEVANYSDLYPSTTMPETKSLGEVLQNNDSLATQVINILLENDYLDSQDASVYVALESNADNQYLSDEALFNALKLGLIAIGVGVVAIATGAIAIAAGVAVTASVFPVGTIIAGAACVLGGIIFGIATYFSQEKKAEKAKKAFRLMVDYAKYINSDGSINQEKLAADGEVNRAEVRRLQIILDDVTDAVNTQFSGIKIFEISNSTKDNDDREFSICTGDDISYGLITSTGEDENGRKKYRVQLYSDADRTVDNDRFIINEWSPISNFANCSFDENCVYMDSDNKHQLYIVNPSLSQEDNQTEEAEKAVGNTLSGYYFMVTDFNINQLQEKLTNTIYNAIEKSGFELEDD